MKRAHATNGLEHAEGLEADVVADESRRYEDAVRDLVCLAGFLAPASHRSTGVDRAATVITKWAEATPHSSLKPRPSLAQSTVGASRDPASRPRPRRRLTLTFAPSTPSLTRAHRRMCRR